METKQRQDKVSQTDVEEKTAPPAGDSSSHNDHAPDPDEDDLNDLDGAFALQHCRSQTVEKTNN